MLEKKTKVLGYSSPLNASSDTLSPIYCWAAVYSICLSTNLKPIQCTMPFCWAVWRDACVTESCCDWGGQGRSVRVTLWCCTLSQVQLMPHPVNLSADSFPRHCWWSTREKEVVTRQVRGHGPWDLAQETVHGWRDGLRLPAVNRQQTWLWDSGRCPVFLWKLTHLSLSTFYSPTHRVFTHSLRQRKPRNDVLCVPGCKTETWYDEQLPKHH